jgi:hypothetical protein
VQSAKRWAFRNPEPSGLIHIETTRSVVLHEGQPHGRRRVLDREGPDLETVVAHRFVTRKLANRHRKLQPITSELDSVPQLPLAAGASPNHEGLLTALETHGPKEPGQTQIMVGMQMRNENLAHPESNAEPHHLALGSFPAIEEE